MITTMNMNRRKCLKSLAALWVGLALPWQDLLASGQPFKNEHPRIALLRSQVYALTVPENYNSENYKGALLRSISLYGEEILVPLDYVHEDEWDDWNDLKALQKVTHSDEWVRWLNLVVSGGNRDTYIPWLA